MLSTEEALESPGDFYFEIETAKQHGGWAMWERLPAITRAKLMAHELHKNMREHYYYDKRSPDKKEKPPKQMAPWDAIQKQFWEGKRA